MATDIPSAKAPVINEDGTLSAPWYRFLAGAVMPSQALVPWDGSLPLPKGYVRIGKLELTSGGGENPTTTTILFLQKSGGAGR